MASVTVVKTIGTTGVFSTLQLWEDGAPANLTTSEKSAAGTFLTAAFVQGEALTFVGSGATGKLLDTDSTGAGTGTYITYGLISGNPAASDVVTGGTSGATCVLSSSTPDNVGVIWQGQCQNQEFSGSGTMLTITGSTSSSTAYKELTTLAGASFRDNANAQTNALQYNASNGCGIRTTGTNGLTINAAEDFCRTSKLQITSTGSGGRALIGSAQAQFHDYLILEGNYTANSANLGVASVTNTGTMRNSVAINRATGADHIIGTGATTPSFYNCTFVTPDDLATAPVSVFLSGAAGTVTVQNCGLFAGDSSKAIKAGSATFNFTTCFSDISGTAGVTQCTYANEFQNVNDATRDYRLKAGAAEINAGTTDATNAAFDIVGTSRPQGSAYDVGCWELIPAQTYTPYFPWAQRGASIDDSATWQGQPLASKTLSPLLTSPRMFGVGGQAPTNRWSETYSADESRWNFVSRPNNTMLTPGPISVMLRAPFIVPNPPIESAWERATRRNSVLAQSPDTGQAKERVAWAFGLPDEAGWIFMPPRDNAALAAGATPFSKRAPTFDDSDAPGWQGRPGSSALLAPLLTAQGQVRARFWPFNTDDAAAWQSAIKINLSIELPAPAPVVLRAPFIAPNPPDMRAWDRFTTRNTMLLTAPPPTNPFVPPPFGFGRDDGAGWQFTARLNLSAANSILFPSSRGGPYITPDDEPAWRPVLQRNLNTTSVAPPSPTTARGWRVVYVDDSSVWEGRPDSAAPVQLLTAAGQPPTKQWGMTYYIDDAIWTASLRMNLSAVNSVLSPASSGGPFNTPDDEPSWRPDLARNFRLLVTPPPGIPLNVLPWRFGYSDDDLWRARPTSSAVLAPILTVGGQVRPSRWMFASDDSSGWQIAFHQNYNIANSGKPSVPYQKSLAVDDGAAWQAPARRNFLLAIPTSPFVPSTRSRFNYSDDALWQMKPSRPPIIYMLGGQVPTVTWKFFGVPDPAPDRRQTTRNLPLLFVPPGATPFFKTSFSMDYTHDDEAIWQWRPRRNHPAMWSLREIVKMIVRVARSVRASVDVANPFKARVDVKSIDEEESGPP